MSASAFDLSGVNLKMLSLSQKDMKYSMMLKAYNYPQFKHYITDKCQSTYGNEFDSFIQIAGSRMIVSEPSSSKHPLLRKVLDFFKKKPAKVKVRFIKKNQIYCSYMK